MPQTLIDWSALLKPVASHEVGEDARLGKWMKARDVPPEDLEVYDMLGAMKAGVERDPVGGHWPSDFKRENHPNFVVGGFNTKTGERVPGSPLAKSMQELIDKGWEPETAKQLWASVQGKK